MESRKKKNKKAHLFESSHFCAVSLLLVQRNWEWAIAWGKGGLKNVRFLAPLPRKAPTSGDHDSSLIAALVAVGLSSPTVPSGLIWLQSSMACLLLIFRPHQLMKGQVSEAGQAGALLPKLDLHLLRLSDSGNKLQNQQLLALRSFCLSRRACVTAQAVMLASIRPSSFLSYWALSFANYWDTEKHECSDLSWLITYFS